MSGIESGQVKWQSPSNIALVKYWGKHGRQLPRNPSISFTLSVAQTTTQVDYEYRKNGKLGTQVDFTFEGKRNIPFQQKIETYLSSVTDLIPQLSHLNLKIQSENSFPHSSGIASSASSMSALALCLVSIEQQLQSSAHFDLEKASLLSRLGSGSAARSVYGPIAVWGKSEISDLSSDQYAIPYVDKIDPVFSSFKDDILIISKNEKAVSSRAGHALMENNPYAAARYQAANNNLTALIAAMEVGDLEQFGDIVEREAFTLHALMMASEPPYLLMEPNTLRVINEIRTFRAEYGVPVYFTLDAGPNVHMLYPESFSEKVSELKESLRAYCIDNRIIEDQVGLGPKQLI